MCFAAHLRTGVADYRLIKSVIGHEYFHNWLSHNWSWQHSRALVAHRVPCRVLFGTACGRTGNRVTCRDWFQLTLKEGLTVYRDQERRHPVRIGLSLADALALAAYGNRS
jgi:aminopeptidase N